MKDQQQPQSWESQANLEARARLVSGNIVSLFNESIPFQTRLEIVQNVKLEFQLSPDKLLEMVRERLEQLPNSGQRDSALALQHQLGLEAKVEQAGEKALQQEQMSLLSQEIEQDLKRKFSQDPELLRQVREKMEQEPSDASRDALAYLQKMAPQKHTREGIDQGKQRYPTEDLGLQRA